jgi:hypothetical protein
VASLSLSGLCPICNDMDMGCAECGQCLSCSNHCSKCSKVPSLNLDVVLLLTDPPNPSRPVPRGG